MHTWSRSPAKCSFCRTRYPNGSRKSSSRPLTTRADSAIVLVEGVSDKVALETLARRRSRDLVAEGVSVVAVGGAQAFGRSLGSYGPPAASIRLAGLCDAAEEGQLRRALERAGFGSNLGRADMERLGFYVCE